ncbi:hypothetical protein SAMN05421510_102714 [Nitrosomonas ureae]|uniref:Uncharacterized protein n=1 Tax=Nitrosomonas ureae TaxID=44577 RepID=A0A1H9E3E7_9PROT|nr:hypothetical protein SAMN05421510_102714 [Nitrosomonas ureae]
MCDSPTLGDLKIKGQKREKLLEIQCVDGFIELQPRIS